MTRKKKLAIAFAAAAAVLIAVCAAAFALAKDIAEKNSIGMDAALSIAMADAAAAEENTVVTKTETDFEKGVFVYDIEFTVAGAGKYDYTLKAADGTILDKDFDGDGLSVVNETTIADGSAASGENATAPATENSTSPAETTEAYTQASSQSGISAADARQIALNYAGVSESDAYFTKAETDTDDGIIKYDIEFRTSSYEYEFEIDLNGDVLSYDKTPSKSAAASAVSSKYIGIDAAKNIALESAGLSTSGVTFTKAKLERENKVYVYEIEFISASMEYEYEINATTGKILFQSSEPLYD